MGASIQKDNHGNSRAMNNGCSFKEEKKKKWRVRWGVRRKVRKRVRWMARWRVSRTEHVGGELQ